MNTAFRRACPPWMAGGAAAFAPALATWNTETEGGVDGLSSGGPRLVFIGTGSSTGCPKPLCSMLFGPNHSTIQELPDLKQRRLDYQPWCRVSEIATVGDPKTNKNYRNNPALLISHCQGSKGECKNFIIDAGKTFREGCLRWFPEHRVTSLDAIVLTHHHMDAFGGLDDVRGFQHTAKLGTFHKAPQMVPMPLHLSSFCLQDAAQRFPWLFPQQQPTYRTGSQENAPAVERHVASFDVKVFGDLEPMDVEGLRVIPLPVWHGADLISYGFAFTILGASNRPTHIVYISDISCMVPETMEYIMTKLPPTDILIVDALMPDQPHPVHFSMRQAVELSERMQAKQTYLIGMGCDAFLPHDEMNEKLQKEYDGKVQLAYDGLVINL